MAGSVWEKAPESWLTNLGGLPGGGGPGGGPKGQKGCKGGILGPCEQRLRPGT